MPPTRFHVMIIRNTIIKAQSKLNLCLSVVR